MYLAQINTNAIGGFSVLTFVMKNDTDPELIPYLGQTLNPNEMTQLPPSGMYFVAIQGQNAVVLAPATFQEAKEQELKPFAVALGKKDENLGNGTGKAAMAVKEENQEKKASTRQMGIWKAKVQKLGLDPATITANGEVMSKDNKLVKIAELV